MLCARVGSCMVDRAILSRETAGRRRQPWHALRRRPIDQTNGSAGERAQCCSQPHRATLLCTRVLQCAVAVVAGRFATTVPSPPVALRAAVRWSRGQQQRLRQPFGSRRCATAATADRSADEQKERTLSHRRTAAQPYTANSDTATLGSRQLPARPQRAVRRSGGAGQLRVRGGHGARPSPPSRNEQERGQQRSNAQPESSGREDSREERQIQQSSRAARRCPPQCGGVTACGCASRRVTRNLTSRNHRRSAAHSHETTLTLSPPLTRRLLPPLPPPPSVLQPPRLRTRPCPPLRPQPPPPSPSLSPPPLVAGDRARRPPSPRPPRPQPPRKRGSRQRPRQRTQLQAQPQQQQ